jgi:hypothetical protein
MIAMRSHVESGTGYGADVIARTTSAAMTIRGVIRMEAVRRVRQDVAPCQAGGAKRGCRDPPNWRMASFDEKRRELGAGKPHTCH